ncbi:MAG TPA: hypothetical protein VF885_06400 [Arthrobacter sp.]
MAGLRRRSRPPGGVLSRSGCPDPQGQPAGGAPRPGELIDVDFPESQPVERKNEEDGRDESGGLGGILGGLFGKK